jgi:hypothetical protein
VAVLGVISASGVILTTGEAEISCVRVGDFNPLRVGVNVNVRVGVIGVTVGMGV